MARFRRRPWGRRQSRWRRVTRLARTTRWGYGHRFGRYRYRGKRHRGYAATKSRVVKLVGTPEFVFYQKAAGNGASVCAPIQFSPASIPGFWDYNATHSEFRLLKASIVIPVDPANATDPAVTSIRRVSSRPFMTTFAASAATFENRNFTPTFNTTSLQQSRFSKLYTPSDTRNSIRVSFYPYTMRWSGRPVGPTAQPGTSFLEYQSGRRWVSMSFLSNTQSSQDDVQFFGPCLIPYGPDNQPTHAPSSDPNPGVVTWTRRVQMTLYCQFRGQK